MVLFLGVLLLAAAVLMFGYGLVIFRRPHAPAWTERYFGEVYAIVVLVLGVFGMTVLLRGVLGGTGDDMTGGLMSLAVVAATVFLWARLKVWTRLKAYEAVTVMPRRDSATPGPGDGRPAAQGRGAGRRRAA